MQLLKNDCKFVEVERLIRAGISWREARTYLFEIKSKNFERMTNDEIKLTQKVFNKATYFCR